MKIAVCFAGHLRCFDNEIVYQSIQDNLLAPLREMGQVDLFFSTWNVLNTQHSFSVHNNNLHTDLIDKPIGVPKLIELYDPVAIDIESFEKCYDFLCSRHYVGVKIDRPIQGYHGMLSLVPQAYKVYRANLLRLKHQKSLGRIYDIVVRYRPDWIVKNRGDFSNLDKETLYIPGGYEPCQTVEDHFAYGNNETMTIYCDLYLYLKELFRLGIHDPSACKFLYQYLRANDIKIQNFDLDFRRHC